jgi:hypothetical protein
MTRLILLLPFLFGCAGSPTPLTHEEIQYHREHGASITISPDHWAVYYEPVSCLLGEFNAEPGDLLFDTEGDLIFDTDWQLYPAPGDPIFDTGWQFYPAPMPLCGSGRCD